MLDRIAFRAMVLKQGDTHAVFLTGDFFSFEQALLDRAMAHLRHVDWLDSRRVLPCVSHCGGAPILRPPMSPQPCAYLRAFGQEEHFARRASEAIANAVDDLRPARIALGSTAVPGFSYNRRSFDAGGKLVMSNFMLPYPRGTPLSGRGPQRPRDPRRCGIGRRQPCSDRRRGRLRLPRPVAPRLLRPRLGGFPRRRPRGDRRCAGRSRRVHARGAGRRRPDRPNRADTRADRPRRRRRRIGGTRAPDAPRAVAPRVRRTTVRVPMFDQGHVEAKMRHTETGEATAGDVRFWEYTRSRLEAGEREFDYPITVVEIGPAAAIVHLPGEAFVQTARAIQERSPFDTTVVISGPTADVGYLCPAEAHEQGGMEPQYAALAGRAEELIRLAAITLLSRQNEAPKLEIQRS